MLTQYQSTVANAVSLHPWLICVVSHAVHAPDHHGSAPTASARRGFFYYLAHNRLWQADMVPAVQVAGVRLSDGSTLPASLVVVGVGARPASQLFKGQLQLDQEGGIVVDSSLQTSVPGVYAIGDVASFPLACEGNTIARQEHVTHARTSAAHAVAAIQGEGGGQLAGGGAGTLSMEEEAM